MAIWLKTIVNRVQWTKQVRHWRYWRSGETCCVCLKWRVVSPVAPCMVPGLPVVVAHHHSRSVPQMQIKHTTKLLLPFLLSNIHGYAEVTFSHNFVISSQDGDDVTIWVQHNRKRTRQHLTTIWISHFHLVKMLNLLLCNYMFTFCELYDDWRDWSQGKEYNKAPTVSRKI